MTFWEERQMEKLWACFQFSFLRRKARLIQGGRDLEVLREQGKSKKNLNKTKDVIKHLPGEQLAVVKIEGKRMEMRQRLKLADMMDR